MNETESNMEAVRGGYAYVRQAMPSTKNFHAVHAEGTRRMILCGCNRGWTPPSRPSDLNRNRRRDDRWGADFRYRDLPSGMNSEKRNG